MRNKKSFSKPRGSLSLPKLQLKRILYPDSKNNSERLHFPTRDDTCRIAGIGKRHFLIDNLTSMEKILNPEKQKDYERNYLAYEREMDEARKQKQYQKKLLENKLFLGDHYLQTQAIAPTYTKQYGSVKRKEKTEYNQEKPRYKSQLKLKTQLKLDTEQAVQPSSLPTYRMDKINQIIQKRLATQQQMRKTQKKISVKPERNQYMNKYQLRIFNPTYMSSNF